MLYFVCGNICLPTEFVCLNSNVQKWWKNHFVWSVTKIVHFTVACLVAKPLEKSEAKVDLVMIKTLLLFQCKLLCYHSNWSLLQYGHLQPLSKSKGLATKYTTVKWPIVTRPMCLLLGAGKSCLNVCVPWIKTSTGTYAVLLVENWGEGSCAKNRFGIKESTSKLYCYE